MATSGSMLSNLEKILASGRESALLRYGLGAECLKANAPGKAIPHLQRALVLDPAYSAAWKLLGSALAACDRLSEALETYRRGIEVAEERGDKQAAKEMQVFARRIEKTLGH